MPTEDKLWLPPLSPKDQQKLDRLRSKGKKSTIWTGFVDRTLWDWIQFFAVLAIPIIVAAGTLYFTQQITLQQAQLSIVANEKQHQTDLQIAEGQQDVAVLQAYLDRMSNLLLNNKLRESKPGDEVRNVARALTLITLSALIPKQGYIDLRNSLIQFLYEAQLINSRDTIVDLRSANLYKADLQDINLNGANFSFAYFWEALLSNTNLNFADLRGSILDQARLNQAHLKGADMRQASFLGTDLSGADLSGAILTGVDLNYASLNGADLSGADLRGSTITEEQLAQAKSLTGATMPDGSRHP